MDIGISSNGGYLGVSSNNALRFATNNTERIRITSDGNVGIGTTNPTGKLTIQSNSTQLRLETASDPSAYHTLIESNYNSANPLNIYSSAAASNAMGTIVLSGITGVNTYLNSYYGIVFGTSTSTITAGTVRMMIANDGNVGIATTSPTAKLEVIGNVKATSFTGSFSGSITHAVSASYALTASYALNAGDSIWTGSAGNIYYSGGNVGIGTASPGYKLDVTGDINVNSGVYRIGGNTILSGTTNVVVGSSGATGTVSLNTTSGAGLVLNGSSVGIGTASPTYKLHTYGTNPRVFIQDSSTGYPILQLGNNSSGNFYFAIDNSAGSGFGSAYGRFLYSEGAYPMVFVTNSAEAMRITSGGNIGIGTTNPAYRLDVNVASTSDALRIQQGSNSRFILNGDGVMLWGGGSANAGFLSWDTSLAIVGGQSGTALALYAAGSEKVRITTNGNVGIGNTNPLTKLFVAGTIRANGTDGQVDVDPTSGAFRFYDGSTFRGGFGTDAWATSGNASNLTTYLNGGNYYIYSTTTGTKIFTALADGNIGIGTTTPAAKLDIVGNAVIRNGYNMVIGDTIANPVASTSKAALTLRKFTSGNASTVVSASYYLGVGGNEYTIGSYRLIGFGYAETSATTTYPAYIGYQEKSTAGYTLGDLIFGTRATTGASDDPTERMRILSGGNVGIGSTSPVSPLDVNGIISSRGIFIAQNSGTYNIIYNASNSAGIYLGGSGDPGNYYDNTTHYFRSGGGGTLYAIINSSGNLGIGTASPAEKLAVNGNIETVSPYGKIGFDVGDAYGDYPHYGLGKSSGSNVVNLAGYYGLTFGTEGTERIRITGGAGNVGIGTTSPSAKLHIQTTSNSDQELLRLTVAPADSSGAKPKAILGFYTPAETNTANYTSGRITSKFDTAGYANSRVTIESLDSGGNFLETLTAKNGNVGIGTTNPAYLFQVNGSAYFNGTANIVYFDGLTRFGGVGSYNTVITSAGNVGIGTTNPTTKLHVTATTDPTINIGTLNANTGNAGIQFFSGTGGSNNGFLLQYIKSSSTDRFGFIDGGSGERLTITNGGNVGIGTTSPTQKLEVSGGDALIRNAFIGLIPSYGSNYTSFSHTSRSAVDKYSFLSGNAGDTYINGSNGFPIYFRQENIDQMVITAGGNVGIGTVSPPYKLSVVTTGTLGFNLVTAASTVGGPQVDLYDSTRAQETVISSTDGTTVGTYLASYSNHPLLFGTNAGSTPTAKMVILPSGNVGIASAAPAFALDVNGIVRATALIETSAKKYKTNIQPLEPQLNKVLQLQPVTFDWKEKKQERPSIGLIADEVIDIYPEFVVKSKEDEIEGIDYSKLTAVLIQSVKELKEIIDRQQEQINALLNK
jgi:hypothetical protein